MHEGHLQAEHPAPRLGVDQLGSLLGERLDRRVHVVDLVGDVMHPGPALGEESPDRRVGAERREQLDPTLADAHGRGLDALLLDALTVLEPSAEEPLVRRYRDVEILDGDADMVNASCVHTGDGTVATMAGRLVPALLAVAVLAAGCGGGGKGNGEAEKPPNEVVTDAQNAATAAKAVHVAGAIVDNGVPLTLDLWLVKGTGGKGSMAQQSLRFEIMRVGDKTYIKGSEAFLRRFAGAAGAALLRGKWLEGSATKGQLAALAPLTDIAKLFDSALASHGTLRNRGETEYRDQKVVAIKDITRGGTLYVAAEGTPYPVAIVGGQERGEIRFDHWNETVSIEAPKDAVDLSKFGR